METQVKVPPPPSTARKILTRIFYFVLVATIIGCVTRVLIAASNQGHGPAGFTKGLLHGALMPCAMPNLIVGNDVTIYALNNTGRTYKLGYTMGVNGCGALFFGLFFWRLNRWRARTRNESVPDRRDAETQS
jgi:hypothetical protein